jgi:hypothetical protein
MMKKILVLLWSILLITCVLGGANAVPYNVALNKPVTLNGTFFTGGWGSGLTVPASTIVDGVFFPQMHQWDQGPVWWDGGVGGGGQSITIDLLGLFTIESLIVQADNNDAYDLFYYLDSGGTWQPLWNVPSIIPQYGMQTRPNPSDNTARYILPSPIVTSALRSEGVFVQDPYYSISEIQAFGEPIPEPGTMLLLGAGLIGLAGLRRRFKNK